MKPQGRILAAGVTGLGADASMIQINRDLGAILILTEFAVLSVIAMILLLAILRGSDATCGVHLFDKYEYLLIPG